MGRFWKRFFRDEHGSYIVFMALALPIMAGMAGLGTEGAIWLFKKRALQGAADNASYSAATAYAVSTSSDLLLHAQSITGSSGLVHGADGVTVAVNHPPAAGCGTASNYDGNTHAIEVTVSQTVTRYFSSFYSEAGSATICSRSITLVNGGGDCVLALGANGTGISADKKANNLNINLDGCSLFSNAVANAAVTGSDSISLTGNGISITAETIGAVGSYNITGNNGTTSVTPTGGNPPIPDPYKTDALTWSSVCTTGCTRYPTNGAATYSPVTSGSPKVATLSPGNYPNGIDLNTASAIYTMTAGVYYLGGDFTISKSNIVLNGTGVTIIITGNHVFDASKASNSSMTLTPSTTGAMQGILIWEPTATGTNNIGNNSFSANLKGVIYAPNANVYYSNSGNITSNCLQLLAGSITFGGNSLNISSNCDTVPGAKKFGQTTALVQ